MGIEENVPLNYLRKSAVTFTGIWLGSKLSDLERCKLAKQWWDKHNSKYAWMLFISVSSMYSTKILFDLKKLIDKKEELDDFYWRSSKIVLIWISVTVLLDHYAWNKQKYYKETDERQKEVLKRLANDLKIDG